MGSVILHPFCAGLTQHLLPLLDLGGGPTCCARRRVPPLIGGHFSFAFPRSTTELPVSSDHQQTTNTRGARTGFRSLHGDMRTAAPGGGRFCCNNKDLLCCAFPTLSRFQGVPEDLPKPLPPECPSVCMRPYAVIIGGGGGGCHSFVLDCRV